MAIPRRSPIRSGSRSCHRHRIPNTCRDTQLSVARRRRFFASCLGTDRVTFTATSDDVPGEVRRFDSLRACADKIAQSRVYAGIHFGFSGKNGLELGRKVAEFAAANFERMESAIRSRVFNVSKFQAQP